MTPTELAAVIEDHRLWLAGKGGKRANLYGADLRGAILDGADLSGADLSGAILDETTGIVWARSGPCGIGPREILGWWTPAEGLVIAAGCFRGSPAEMRTRVAAGGWEWPAADRDRLAASVEKHLARVEGDVTEWLAACGGAA